MQNELIVKHHPPPVPAGTHCAPNENSILEWLLRSNTADDGPWSKPLMEQQLFPNTVMPYFEVDDEPYHGADVDLTPAFVAPPATTTKNTTSSNARTSETTTPPLPFDDA